MAHCSQTMMNLTFKIKISLFPLLVICEQCSVGGGVSLDGFLKNSFKMQFFHAPERMMGYLDYHTR